MNKTQGVLLAGAVAMAGLIYSNWSEYQQIPEDTSESSQPSARKAYLSEKFPQFSETAEKFGASLRKPAKSFKSSKNEWNEVYHLGYCKDLPVNWTDSLRDSFGKNSADIWGSVMQADKASPVSIVIRQNQGEFFHVHMTEFNDRYFAEKLWYKSWRKSVLDIKSRYTLAFLCESRPDRNYHDDHPKPN